MQLWMWFVLVYKRLNKIVGKARLSTLKELLRRIKNLIKLRIWIQNGKKPPVPHLYKQKVVKDYAKKFSLNTFIETGTYTGN